MTKHLTIILKKQCKIVGANFDDIDFSGCNWFGEYTWTPEQEKDFLDWHFRYLMSNKEAREEMMTIPRKDKRAICKTVEGFNLNYGWRIKYGN